MAQSRQFRWARVAAVAAVALATAATPSAAGMEPFVGEIAVLGSNFCPQGWTLANGAILPIVQYPALFSLLGTTYGGNGTTTFALPRITTSFATATTINGNTVTAPLAATVCIALEGVFPARP